VKKPVKQHGKKKTKRPVKKSVHAKQTTYLVRDGDSLSTIATAQLGKERRWVDIAELNGLEPPYTVQPGTRIKLPPR
jgi:nucleoid-associated protein YgaU